MRGKNSGGGGNGKNISIWPSILVEKGKEKEKKKKSKLGRRTGKVTRKEVNIFW